MKSRFYHLLSSLITFWTLLCLTPLRAGTPPTLVWTTSFDQAQSTAKKEQKPLFLYFSGSDWCSWCQKLDDEVLQSNDFIALIGPKFVFYQADFPVYKKLGKEQEKQNEELKTKYAVAGFPTIVLLDPNLHEFAKLSYKEGGGKVYANQILKILEEQKQFEASIKNVQNESIACLQSLYERSKRLGMKEAKADILKEGLKRGDFAFFMKEEYRRLLTSGKPASKEATTLRQKILALDPTNKRRLHYDVAVIEFEAQSQDLHLHKDATKAIEPLKNYLNTFGQRDLKTRWKIEMIIAQTLSSKEQFEEALVYAKDSEAHAPFRHRLTIAQAIQNLEERFANSALIANEEESP